MRISKREIYIFVFGTKKRPGNKTLQRRFGIQAVKQLSGLFDFMGQFADWLSIRKVFCGEKKMFVTVLSRLIVKTLPGERVVRAIAPL